MKKSLFDLGVPFLAGGVLFLLTAYGTGLVTASNTARENVAAARIDERAVMCQEAAVAYLAHKAEQTPVAAATDLPKALAEQFFVATGDARRDRMVLEECTRKLSV
jgi:hypothetical protein